MIPKEALWGFEPGGRASLELGLRRNFVSKDMEPGLSVMGSKVVGLATVSRSGLGEEEARGWLGEAVINFLGLTLQSTTAWVA